MPPREPKPVAGSSERVESVTQFTARIKALLEREIPSCWVRGEVSNLRVQASGHVYFSFKDSGAQLSAVLFRGDALRQSVKLRDGLQVLAFGGLSLYEPRGQYQLVVRAIIEDGVGRLQLEFEALKRRLAAEGLFESERKKPLPALPARVGFLTSPTGAAVRDFIKILQRRCWRGHCLVLPAKVQGAGAADEMAALLAWAGQLRLAPDGSPAEPRGEEKRPRFFDLIVVGRGGGSLEDLWAFNEEVLVRALAACPVPTISAVGHEIDFTLCDFAADQRAETPSGAAELISSRFLEVLQRAEQAAESLAESADRALDDARGALLPLKGRLRLLAPAAQVERGFLRLDDLSNRLASVLRHATQAKRAGADALRGRLQRCSPETRIQVDSHRLLSLYKRLQAASPQSVLNRGFAIVRDEQGRPLARKTQVAAGQRVRAQFSDGEVGFRAD